MHLRLIIWLIFHIVFHLTVFGQAARLTSFQQTQRWVSESNFPLYTNQKDIQDSIFQHVAASLKKKFNVEQVDFPTQIEYDYIGGFGKAKIKMPAGSTSTNDYQVSILSFITRATAGFAVEWHMEARIQQNGKTILSKKTEHELEYYSVYGYMRPIVWMDKTEFASRIRSMIDEVLELGDPLPEKIVIGSYKQIEDEVMKAMQSPAKYLLKTSGNFLDAGHYSMNLQSETDTITTVAYRDGWDGSTSPLINTSELAAGFFKSITGIDMAYNYKSREKRFGKLEYKNGRKLKLRMEWSEETKMYTDGSTGEKYYRSPMIAELYENEELTGYFGFQKKSPVSNSKQTADYTFMNSPNYYLDGKIKELPVNLEYDPRTSYLTVKQNDRMLITLVLMNMNPESRSVAGQTLSRNKVFMSSGSLKPKFKNSEWYYLYYDPSITADEMNQYIDAILCLFFGIGKEKS